MSHDPERLAAAYLTTMRVRLRRRFEAHLLTCEPCWHEVCLARQGRHLAEAARDLAPRGLLEDIRAAVAAAALPAARPHLRWRIMVAAVAAIAVLAVAAVRVQPWPHSRPVSDSAVPAVIAAAVASYRTNRLPGTAVPAEPAPQLSALNLDLAGAGRGELNGMAVTMFAYRTPLGARLTIFRSSEPFPEADKARELGGTEGAWTVLSSGVTIICAQGAHTMLLLGSNATLVRQAGALLNAI